MHDLSGNCGLDYAAQEEINERLKSQKDGRGKPSFYYYVSVMHLEGGKPWYFLNSLLK